jgi:hypothetical protein
MASSSFQLFAALCWCSSPLYLYLVPKRRKEGHEMQRGLFGVFSIWLFGPINGALMNLLWLIKKTKKKLKSLGFFSLVDLNKLVN